MAGILAAETVAGAVVSYLLLFTTFAHYDDEGTFMVWDRQLLEGLPLYDVVWTFYGPTPFLLRHVLYRLLGIGPGHDVIRFYSMGVWLATCGLLAVATHRLTRSRAAAALTYLLVFLWLIPLTREPGHSQSMVGLLLGALALAGTTLERRPSPAALATVGALVAAMVLTKVNAGSFVLLAVALCAVAGAPRSPLVLVARGGVVLALALAAPVVMRDDFGATGVGGLGVTYSVGLMLVAASLLGAGGSGVPLRGWNAAVAGAAAATVVIVGGMLALGSSLGALVHSVFVLPSRLSSWVEGRELALPFPTWALGAGLFALWLGLGRRPGGERRREFLRGAVLVLLGAACCALPLIGAPAAVLSRLGVVSFGLSFVWLLVVSPGRLTWARAVLVACAATMPLSAYPMAGSQLVFGTVLLVVCGVLALHDGLVAFAPFAPSVLRRPARIAFAAAMAALLATGWASRLAPAHARHRAFVPLGLPGATRLRLAETDVAAYRWLATTVARSCDTFLGAPGLCSLYLWAEVPLPSALLHDRWFLTFDEPTRRAILTAFQAYPRRCAIRSEWLLALGMSAGRVAPDARDGPTIGLAPVGRAGKWELFAADDTPTLPLVRGAAVARLGGGRLTFSIVPAEGTVGGVARVTVYDPVKKRLVVDAERRAGGFYALHVPGMPGVRVESVPWRGRVAETLVRVQHGDGRVETLPIVRVER